MRPARATSRPPLLDMFRQFQEFAVQSRIGRHHFKHSKFPRLAFCVRHLAAGFLEDEIGGRKIPDASGKRHAPIAATGATYAALTAILKKEAY